MRFLVEPCRTYVRNQPMTHGKVGRLVWGWYHVFLVELHLFHFSKGYPICLDTCQQTHLDVESPEFLKDSYKYIYIYKWWVLNVYIDLLDSLFGFKAMFKSYLKHVESKN